MKKNYLLLASILLAGGLFAQSPLRINQVLPNEHVEMSNDVQAIQTYKDINPGSSTFGTRATNIVESISAIDLITDYYGTATSRYLAYSNPLFPDTNVIIQFTNSQRPPFVHSFAQVIDLMGLYATSPGSVFDPAVQPFVGTEPFTIDSIQFRGIYSRFDITTVDTAIITVHSKANGQFTRSVYGGGDSAKFVIDHAIKTNDKILPDNAIATYKVVLDAAFLADTFPNGSSSFEIATGLAVTWNHDGLVAVAIAFKPGRTGFSKLQIQYTETQIVLESFFLLH